jgi:hypothetical protein
MEIDEAALQYMVGQSIDFNKGKKLTKSKEK